ERSGVVAKVFEAAGGNGMSLEKFEPGGRVIAGGEPGEQAVGALRRAVDAMDQPEGEPVGGGFAGSGVAEVEQAGHSGTEPEPLARTGDQPPRELPAGPAAKVAKVIAAGEVAEFVSEDEGDRDFAIEEV